MDLVLHQWFIWAHSQTIRFSGPIIMAKSTRLTGSLMASHLSNEHRMARQIKCYAIILSVGYMYQVKN